MSRKEMKRKKKRGGKKAAFIESGSTSHRVKQTTVPPTNCAKIQYNLTYPTGGGLIKYTVLIKYTGVIKYTARKPILSVEICEIKYTVFVYIFLRAR